MKRIFLLLSVALLISCTQQQESKNTTAVTENETEVTDEISPDAVPDVDDATVVLEPSTQSIELGEVEGGGYQTQEISELFRQGTSAYANNDFKTGITFFNKIIEENPEDPRAYYNLGIGYFRLNKFPEAIKAFSGAINISPMDSLAIQFRGRVYYMMGNFKSSLEDYKRVVELTPTDPVAYYNRGLARGRTNDYLGAIMDFDKTIELDPENAKAYYNRGLANLHQGRLHDACYDWRKAHSLGHYEAEKAIRGYCEGNKEE